jgi:outer membrane murein-binding lipoprotein Lpp
MSVAVVVEFLADSMARLESDVQVLITAAESAKSGELHALERADSRCESIAKSVRKVLLNSEDF